MSSTTTITDNGEQLVKEYHKSHSQGVKELVVRAYAPLVKYVVGRINVSQSSTLRKDDLYQFGVIGLLEALERFDPEKGVPFKNYAYKRINGEVVDALRREGALSREKLEKLKKIEKATQELMNKFGRDPLPFEVSQAINITEEEYYAVIQASQLNYSVSLDQKITDGDGDYIYRSETIEDESQLSAEDEMTRENLKEELKKQLQDLPERQKIILALYFYEELTLEDIGQVLDLTESRVSQILNQTLVEIKAKMMQ